jgi:hypothetical protein
MILKLSPPAGLVSAILGARLGSDGPEGQGAPITLFINYGDSTEAATYARSLIERIIVEGYRLALADGTKEVDSKGSVRFDVPLNLGEREFVEPVLAMRFTPGKTVADVLFCTSTVSKYDVVKKILEMGLFHVKLSVEN